MAFGPRLAGLVAGGLRDDADHVRRVVSAELVPTILVGHSYGGAVISEASCGVDNVDHLVYVCAFLFDAGQSVLQAVGGTPPPWWCIDHTSGIVDVNDPTGTFFPDLDADLASTWTRRLGRQALTSFTEEQRGAGWRDIPSTYMATVDDRAMARQADRVVEIGGGHSPLATRPDTLVEVMTATPPRPGGGSGGL